MTDYFRSEKNLSWSVTDYEVVICQTDYLRLRQSNLKIIRWRLFQITWFHFKNGLLDINCVVILLESRPSELNTCQNLQWNFFTSKKKSVKIFDRLRQMRIIICPVLSQIISDYEVIIWNNLFYRLWPRNLLSCYRLWQIFFSSEVICHRFWRIFFRDKKYLKDHFWNGNT